MNSVIAPSMLACLLVVLLLGYPVAFSLAAIACVFGVIGLVTGAFDPPFLLAMLFRLQGIFGNDNLLAIPMLIFMGVLLERTAIAEDMFAALGRLFSRLSGGIAYGTILVGALLSSMTGFVSASVVAIGLISLPVMVRAGYNHSLATGVAAASGTLAQIIPPSLVLIILAEQMEVSLQAIFHGAVIPSLMLISLYVFYIFARTWHNPSLAPAIASMSDPQHEKIPLWRDLLVSMGLPVGLVGLVLASISFGIATPSEGGAIGVTGTLLLALMRGRLTPARLKAAMDATGILCACIIFLLIGASFFTLVFRGFDGHLWVENLLSLLPQDRVGFVVLINLLLLVLAFFLDFFEIAFIVLPLIAPVANRLGIDMVWLSVIIAVNLQTSFMHPPFGLALYNLRSVAPRSISTASIYWGAVPFIGIQFLVVVLLILFPKLVLKEREVKNPAVEINIQLPEAMPPLISR